MVFQSVLLNRILGFMQIRNQGGPLFAGVDSGLCLGGLKIRSRGNIPTQKATIRRIGPTTVNLRLTSRNCPTASTPRSDVPATGDDAPGCTLTEGTGMRKRRRRAD